MICKICSAEIDNDRHFSAKHKITQKEYYLRYEPRFDLHDGAPIEFKDKDQYLAARFNNKTNMSAWLYKVSKEEAKQFILDSLRDRIERKELKFAPSFVEIKCCDTLPSPAAIKKVVGSYSSIVDELGVVNRFPVETAPPIPNKKIKIAIDTREQTPIYFKDSLVTKIDVGDYTIIGEGFENIYIERKAANDFISTFTGAVDRFRRELDRAKEIGAYIVVLAEKPLSYLRGFDKTYLKRFCKSSPKFLFHNVTEILKDYDNVQFIFVEKEDAARYIERILKLGVVVKDVDLQWLIEEGKF